MFEKWSMDWATTVCYRSCIDGSGLCSRGVDAAGISRRAFGDVKPSDKQPMSDGGA